MQVHTLEQCQRLLIIARDGRRSNGLNWESLILTALVTGIRRGELLNATWRDVDCANLTIEVDVKKNADETWVRLLKDLEDREFPLTDDVVNMLAEHQNEHREGCPCLVVPPWRWERIQKLAGIEEKTFHGFHRTALTNWLVAGMSEHDAMTVAG